MNVSQALGLMIRTFQPRSPPTRIKAQDARTDLVIAQAKRECEKLNDRIERITAELIDEMRGR